MADSAIELDESFVISPPAAGPDVAPVLAALNSLYLAESCSFFRYLDSWTPWTDARTVQLRSLVRSITRASFDHAERISRLMTTLGGSPTPGSFRKTDADSNYADWPSLLPRLLDAKRQMIVRCDQALSALHVVNGADEAVALVTAHRAENASHLDALRTWSARLAS